MGSVFGSKPSDSHIIWRSGRDNDGKKRFDFEYLELWAAHFGIEYEEWERVDHERGDEPRTQHACVFTRAKSGGEEVSLGGKTWTMGGTEKPRTFIEIDDAGMLRLRGWTIKRVLDIDEMIIDGPKIKLRTADGETKSLDARKLCSRPDRKTA